MANSVWLILRNLFHYTGAVSQFHYFDVMYCITLFSMLDVGETSSPVAGENPEGSKA